MDVRLRGLPLAAALVSMLVLPAAAPAAIGESSIESIEKLEANGPIEQAEAERIARRDPNAIAAKREHPDLSTVSEREGGGWQVGFFSDDKEIVQVVVDDLTGRVKESWTGHQVAWKMARGYEGAFGRKLNAPYVWLPLCAIFVLGLLDWRRWRRIAHLDLVVIVAGFGLSHYFFNRGEVGLSVPLAYPPLVYLLARMLWIGVRRREGGLSPTAPTMWLLVGVLFLVGFRVGLNVERSNVIDVGYSGVIGADRIADREPVYGNFPSDDHAGDTYGPFAYYAYVPFEQILPWSGEWDQLPAAHAAAIFFDLATVAGLFLLGRALRGGKAGRRLGAILAFGWAACPYTAFALESNTNDALVAALLVAIMLALSSPPGRGALLALASAVKFAPVALAPLFATYRAGRSDDIDPRAGPSPLARWIRVVAPFSLAFVATLAIVLFETALDPGLSTFYDRTAGFQAGRDSPFSVWGQAPSLEWVQTALKVGVGLLAVVVALRPRRRDAFTVAALATAVLIAVQLTVEHWFYLYIPWFLPLLLVALAAGGRAVSASPAPASAPAR